MTPSDILRIARAIGLQVNDDGCVCVLMPDDEWPEYVWRLVTFDPLNSNDDAFRMLAWILRQDICHEIDRERIIVWDSLGMELHRHEHDGTEAGLRRAITEAAGRVVG